MKLQKIVMLEESIVSILREKILFLIGKLESYIIYFFFVQ